MADDDGVVSLASRRLSKMLDPISEQAEMFEHALRAFLSTRGFKPLFIEAVVPDLVEAYMNEDERPLWHNAWYEPPEAG